MTILSSAIIDNFMEHYEYFCTITKHLYQELENISAKSYLMLSMGLDNEEYEQLKSELLHKIEDHLQGLDLA